MLCTKCGAEIREGDRFCAQCGAPTKGIDERVEERLDEVADDVAGMAEGIADRAREAAQAAMGEAEEAQAAIADAAVAARDGIADAVDAARSRADEAMEAIGERIGEPDAGIDAQGDGLGAMAGEAAAGVDGANAHAAEAAAAVGAMGFTDYEPAPGGDGFTDYDGQATAQQAPQQPTQQMPQAAPQQWQPQQPYAQQGQYGQQQPYAPQQPQQQQVRKAWYETLPARIAMCVCGGILIVSGIARIVGAVTPARTDNPPIVDVDDPDGKDVEADDKDGKVDDKAGKAGDKAGKADDEPGGDGDHDVIITDGNDTIISDGNDIVITAPSVDGNGKVDYGGGDTYGTWAPECLSDDGMPTGYAISELKGWQLETLCQEAGLTWNDGGRQWEGDGYALIVYDEDHERLDDEEIARLGKGCAETRVVYEIQSTRWPSPTDAFREYVSRYMVNEDFRPAGSTSWAGSVYGPSMTRMLVMGYAGTVVDYSMVQLIPGGTIESGAYDTYDKAEEIYGHSEGGSVDEVFLTKTGHRPGDDR